MIGAYYNTIHISAVTMAKAKYQVSETGEGIIPAGTIKIVDRAFKGCMELRSIVIPATVDTIGEGALYS